MVLHGYIVLLGSSNLSNGQKAAEEIGEGGVAIWLDVTDAQSIANAAKRVADEFGRLDVLVNNAAIVQSGRYASSQEVLAASAASAAPLDEVREVFETRFSVLLPLRKRSCP